MGNEGNMSGMTDQRGGAERMSSKLEDALYALEVIYHDVSDSKETKAYYEGLKDQLRQLAEQRAALLEALVVMESKAVRQNWNDDYPEQLAQARAAIALAQGDAA